jgi:hypothetical protein
MDPLDVGEEMEFGYVVPLPSEPRDAAWAAWKAEIALNPPRPWDPQLPYRAFCAGFAAGRTPDSPAPEKDEKL